MKSPIGGVQGVSRRRFIAITAAAAGSAYLPRSAAARSSQTYTWRGVALGASSTLTLQHEDEAEAKSAIAACLAEVARLEMVFSLHRPESALSTLNRFGSIVEAPQDLRALLAEALHLAAATKGAFDPTIQPLWALYARHFSDSAADPEGPSTAEIARARALTGWRDISISESRIAFSRPGMAVTLNGIAQGYITDKVGELLRARGFNHVLVNMGEQLATGPKWEGNAWTIGVKDPIGSDALIEEIPISEGAVATSGGSGYRFDEAGRFTHILDPRTGRPARHIASVSVVADRATLADGLSTALSVLPPGEWAPLLGDRTRAFAVALNGVSHAWY